ncbi:E3 ubiquitin-protein ligase [Forsythia ovata]|uniref:RING-type E3 ubiquitin transferase n=1 Tax=Forsythia ovata TaxID=205694 RepID=A0ABD1TNX3_9LAMI
MADQNSTEAIIMAAISTLSPSQISDLSHSIAALFHCHRRRLFSLLSSPTIFSFTLQHLQTISLHKKSLLIAHYLLLNLSVLNHFVRNSTAGPPYSAAGMKLRDLDAVLLLLLLCELHQHEPEALESPPSFWRGVLCNYMADTMLKLTSFGASNGEVLIQFIEKVAKCRNFVNVMGGDSGGTDEGKDGREVAASVAAVVALPSVEVSGGGRECVICKEEMIKGRDVCELPCSHLFHWMCILPWLKKRNTCPCCRCRLPTADVLAEIDRLLEDLVKIGGGGGGLIGECSCT